MANTKAFLELEKFIDELLEELVSLNQKKFPKNQTRLFYTKSSHLASVLGVETPKEKNFSELLNWLLGLKYRLKLQLALEKGKTKTRKKLELSIPSLAHFEFEQE